MSSGSTVVSGGASSAAVVQLGTVSVSGPHSVMEVIEESRVMETSPKTAQGEVQQLPQPISRSTAPPQGSAVSEGDPMERECENDSSLETDGACVGKRPPPLDMTQDPSLVSGDGPKTPISPRTRSATSKVDREKKIGHRRVGEAGEVTYKKIHTSQIMGSIQLGIGHAVGGLASKPDRDLLMQDFITIETTNFPSQGSQLTPAHHFSDFKFKTYAPIAFRYFRDLFGIQPDDFLLSLCNEPLRELSNPGASGSIFYLSADDEFIIKTVQHKEGEFLMKLLLGYYMNLNQNPRTLLPKFFGLYCYQCNSKNVRMAVMNNLLPSAIKMHEKYDLKGSTYKRKASKSERSKSVPTYKDLDFMDIHPEGILLEADTYTALIKTIQRDCRVLESFKIMDYSLLVGIHNLDIAAREEAERRRTNSTGDDEGSGDETGPAAGTSAAASGAVGVAPLVRSRSINRQKLVAHSTALESIQAESEPIDEEDDVPPGGIPARNAKGERLLLFLGIIDILQSYRLKKKLEHTLKAMIHDGDTVSVHRPGFYSSRFQSFMANKVFKRVPSPLKHSPSKKKLTARTRATSVTDGTVGPGGPVLGADNLASSQESVTFRTRGPAGAVSAGVTAAISAAVSADSNSLPSSSSTPPPAFEDVLRSPGTSGGRGLLSGSQSHGNTPVRSRIVGGSQLWNSHIETVSLSEVQLEAAGGIGSASGLSKASSASGESGVRTGLTSSAHTPTWTEGTPSFTESSSSGDLACPGTPAERHAHSPQVRRQAKETTTIVYQENEMTHL